MTKLKQERLSGIISRDVSDIIQFEMKEPKLGIVSVTDVDLTADYSLAKIYVSILGNDKERAAGLELLRKAKGFIRSRLASQLDIRKCPDLIFELDDSLRQGDRIDQIISKLNKGDQS